MRRETERCATRWPTRVLHAGIRRQRHLPSARETRLRACPRTGRTCRSDGSLSRMIRKLPSGGYRLYSRKVDPRTGKRRNLGTFPTREAAEKHEREVQFFK